MPTTPERQREYRLERIAAGLCPRCGNALGREGFKLCVTCGNKSNAYRRSWCLRNKVSKPCVDCGKDREANAKRYCKVCAAARAYDAHKEARKRLYHSKKDVGLCQRCSQPARDGFTLCEPCGEHHNLTRRRNKALDD